jgi:hypothetical protein
MTDINKELLETIFNSTPSPYQHLIDYVDGLSQDEQEYLYHLVKGRLDYYGRTWQRADVDAYLERPSTDEEWDAIKETFEWCILNDPSDNDLYILQEAVDSVVEDKVEQ